MAVIIGRAVEREEIPGQAAVEDCYDGDGAEGDSAAMCQGTQTAESVSH